MCSNRTVKMNSEIMSYPLYLKHDVYITFLASVYHAWPGLWSGLFGYDGDTFALYQLVWSSVRIASAPMSSDLVYACQACVPRSVTLVLNGRVVWALPYFQPRPIHWAVPLHVDYSRVGRNLGLPHQLLYKN